jgi:hypothetical protein
MTNFSFQPVCRSYGSHLTKEAHPLAEVKTFARLRIRLSTMLSNCSENCSEYGFRWDGMELRGELKAAPFPTPWRSVLISATASYPILIWCVCQFRHFRAYGSLGQDSRSL